MSSSNNPHPFPFNGSMTLPSPLRANSGFSLKKSVNSGEFVTNKTEVSLSFLAGTLNSSSLCLPCHHGMARPQVANIGDNLQIRKVDPVWRGLRITPP
jgi:hypothetical protein